MLEKGIKVIFIISKRKKGNARKKRKKTGSMRKSYTDFEKEGRKHVKKKRKNKERIRRVNLCSEGYARTLILGVFAAAAFLRSDVFYIQKARPLIYHFMHFYFSREFRNPEKVLQVL